MTPGEADWKVVALARLADAKAKGHRRLGHRKSRGGCRSCKSRRLKCDETYPECTRCTRAGRRCEGYTPSPTSSMGSSCSSVILSPTTTHPKLQPLDRRPFEYFLDVVAPTLGGSLDHEFWTQTVLQISHDEDFVKDSLLAISILYEHPQYTKSLRGKDRFFDPHTDSTKSGPSMNDERHLLPPFLTTRHAEALYFCNRAIKTFRQKLVDGTATPLTTLLSCILFSCIDVMRDHVFGALQTITQAAHIMKMHHASPDRPSDSDYMKTMYSTVHRMSNLAAVYGFTKAVVLTPHQPHNDTSITLQSARDALFQLTTEINLFIWQVSNRGASYDFNPDTAPTSTPAKDTFNIPYFPKPTSIRPPSALLTSTPSVALHQHALQTRLQTWHDTFHPLALPPSATSGLWMYYHLARLLLSTHLCDSEMVYDGQTHAFRRILRHAEGYVSGAGVQRATFTFEQGAIGPLSVVAIKCRVPSLRRRALRALERAPRKEAMWGAAGVGQLCARIVAVEEAGLGLPVADYRGCHEGEVDDTKMPTMAQRARYVELLRNDVGEFEARITRHHGMGETEVHPVCD